MKDDLAAEYGLSRAAAKALVQQDRILPLLDGLDEVAQDRRAACVQAIHAYQHGRDLGQLAVCCRVAEYAEIPNLDFGAAVRVEKLTRADVDREISKPRLEYARRALEADPELWAVVDTPLWLHVLFGAAQVEWPRGSQKPNIRERLYARYVESALGRTAEGSPRTRTAREPLLHRLGWLAAEMRRRDQAQFAFEDLDFSWNVAGRTQWAARGSVALVAGLLLALLVGPISGLAGLRIFGPVSGLVLGLAVGGVSVWWGPITVLEEHQFVWLGAKRGLVYGLVGGLVFGLVGGLVLGLAVGLLGGLFGGLLAVLQPRPLGGRSAPNRATLRSLRYTLWIALSGWVLTALLVILAMQSYFPVDVPGLVPFGVSCCAAILSLEKGGLFALRHYTVRFFLWRSGFAPLGYVRFLNEAVERLFLMAAATSSSTSPSGTTWPRPTAPTPILPRRAVILSPPTPDDPALRSFG